MIAKIIDAITAVINLATAILLIIAGTKGKKKQ